MGLLIKGMKLPKNCVLCPCCVGEGIGMGRQHYCQAIEDEPCVSETYRPKNCPLVEIHTPHGRLIDADTVEKRLQKYWYEEYPNQEASYHRAFMDSNDCVKDLPTIIEAEANE